MKKYNYSYTVNKLNTTVKTSMVVEPIFIDKHLQISVKQSVDNEIDIYATVTLSPKEIKKLKKYLDNNF